MKSLNYFKALADSTRIRIYNILLENELSVNELVQLFEVGQSGISRHLKILTDSGLLNCRRSGVRAFYSADQSPENEKFIGSVKYLFEEEFILNQDLLKVQRIIAERSLETRHFFNTIAHKWDLLKLDIMGDFDLNAVIIDNIPPCTEVADLGCGTGELLSILTKKAEKVIGVDSSQNMLEESRKRFFNNNSAIDLRLGELEHLPLRDQEAEVAVISLALHHLSNPGAAVAEASRILKPGGTLIIAEFQNHENESFRKTYGDRWPGFSEDEINSWIGSNHFIINSVSRYHVQQALTICIYKSVKQI